MYTIEAMKKVLIESDFEAFKKALDEYDVHENDKFGNNILHYYTGHINHLSLDFKAVYNELFERGLSVNDKQSKGAFKRTCLHMAVRQNDKVLFDFLLLKDPDVNATDANGNSILSTAVFSFENDKIKYGHYIEELLKRKADPDLKNNYGVAARELAKSIANSEVDRFFTGI